MSEKAEEILQKQLEKAKDTKEEEVFSMKSIKRIILWQRPWDLVIRNLKMPVVDAARNSFTSLSIFSPHITLYSNKN